MTCADLIEPLKQRDPKDHVGVESEDDDANYGTVVGVRRDSFNRDRVVIQYEQGASHD